MKTRKFVDGRGDEYNFVLYNTNELKIDKKRANSKGIYIKAVQISPGAVDVLKAFLVGGK